MARGCQSSQRVCRCARLGRELLGGTLVVSEVQGLMPTPPENAQDAAEAPRISEAQPDAQALPQEAPPRTSMLRPPGCHPAISGCSQHWAEGMAPQMMVPACHLSRTISNIHPGAAGKAWQMLVFSLVAVNHGDVFTAIHNNTITTLQAAKAWLSTSTGSTWQELYMVMCLACLWSLVVP